MKSNLVVYGFATTIQATFKTNIDRTRSPDTIPSSAKISIKDITEFLYKENKG